MCSNLAWAGDAVIGIHPPESTRRVLLLGGGDYPTDALKKFIQWSGGSNATILCITWSHENQQGSYEYLAKQINALAPNVKVDWAPTRENLESKVESFYSQLEQANGIFFTGGDQNRTMDLLDKMGTVVSALKNRYLDGIPFAGSSAGTALMSKIMITGDAPLTEITENTVKTRDGLGVITNFIVDQHFLAKQRLPRLMSLLYEEKSMQGIGVDENTGAAVENERLVEVVGESKVVYLRKHPNQAEIKVSLHKPGEYFRIR